MGRIAINPIIRAETPPAPKAKPRPPSPAEAARILTAAWADPEWGTLVWLAIVTGVRRGELCALRWSDVDLITGVVSVSRSIGQRNKDTWEKDTKDHQHRRIAVDEETVVILVEHRGRMEDRFVAVGEQPPGDAFAFSLAPDNSVYMRPNSVSERYSDLADRLGIATSLQKLRHYSATELIAAGVDIRTVAGRLGHGGGGTTTLRVYAAWVSESDQRAAGNLGARMPARPTASASRRHAVAGLPFPYEAIASVLREQIESGALAEGEFLLGIEALAESHGVAIGTAHRAVSLVEAGQVEVVAGRGTRVVRAHPTAT